MADGCEIRALRKNLESHVSNNKLKFKWRGTFDELKVFLREEIKLVGNWSFIESNGGYNLFKCKEISVNFYPGTTTLLLQGANQAVYKDLFSNICKDNVDSSIVCGEESTSSFGSFDESFSKESSTDSSTILFITPDDSQVTADNSVSNIPDTFEGYLKIINDLKSEFDDKINIISANLLTLKDERDVSSAKLLEDIAHLRELNASLNVRNQGLLDENIRLQEEKSNLIRSFNILFNEKCRLNFTDRPFEDLISSKHTTNLHEVQSEEVPQDLSVQLIENDNNDKDNPKESTTTQAQTKITVNKKRKKNKKKPGKRTDNNMDGNQRPGPESTSRAIKGETCVVGDSILKHLSGHKMSSQSVSFRVSTHPGCTTRDMMDYIQPVLRRKPQNIAIHVGTNSLRHAKTPLDCAEEIAKLAALVNTAETKVAVSSLIIRDDDPKLGKMVLEVNPILKRLCAQNNWGFIDNSNITVEQLNASKLHLNKKGTVELARNLSKFFNSK